MRGEVTRVQSETRSRDDAGKSRPFIVYRAPNWRFPKTPSWSVVEMHHHLVTLLDEWRALGVEFVSLEGIDTTTQAGKASAASPHSHRGV